MSFALFVLKRQLHFFELPFCFLRGFEVFLRRRKRLMALVRCNRATVDTTVALQVLGILITSCLAVTLHLYQQVLFLRLRKCRKTGDRNWPPTCSQTSVLAITILLLK